ncbi:hypothetical protein Srufu_079920 (plasmid) [Streptomyces libani subsp. rufus]|uniref:GIY-YIG nuclease family protein n=1 Tax=Streptomyces sp. NPDC048516 TaxID=3365565 RepID=UPI0012E4D37A|nr:hypothetical protein Srufu_079920 [Streptomyces libani subsp. rufus]
MTNAPSAGAVPHPGVGAGDQTSVYRLRDRAGHLLYVGMGRNPMGRWASHAEQHAWWSNVATFDVLWFDTRTEAAEAERRAIREESPMHNIHGRPGWGRYTVAKYAETRKRNAALQAERRAQRRLSGSGCSDD